MAAILRDLADLAASFGGGIAALDHAIADLDAAVAQIREERGRLVTLTLRDAGIGETPAADERQAIVDWLRREAAAAMGSGRHGPHPVAGALAGAARAIAAGYHLAGLQAGTLTLPLAGEARGSTRPAGGDEHGAPGDYEF